MIEAMNHMDIAPTEKFIEHTYGSLTELNEYLGFPNIRGWDETDYIQYGVRFIKENGPNSLTATNLNKLSVRHLGPTKKPIIARFGSLSAFQNLAMAEYARQAAVDEARKIAVEQHFTETDYGKELTEDPEERVLIWGRYQVARACLPRDCISELPKISKLSNGDFVRKLLSLRPELTEEDVEIMAETLQVTDCIWPPKNQRSLKL
jgi:hypothetical protein